MNNTFKRSALFLGAVFILAACGKGDNASSLPKKDDTEFKVYPQDAPADVSAGETIVAESVTSPDMNIFQKYMLEQAGDDNCVFSPESLKSAICLYSHLVSDEDAKAVKQLIGDRDYLTFTDSDVFTTTNRLWVNSVQEIDTTSLDDIKEYIYEMDMTDSAKATKLKDDYVSEMTYGFIDKTPSELKKDTIVDAMNIIYFKDKWEGGEKDMTNPMPFTNKDGSATNIEMMKNSGGSAVKTNNAHAYTMYYENGFTFTAVLPDEGYGVEDVDLWAFINGNTQTEEGICRFKMPPFSQKSEFGCDFGTFGLSNMQIREDIYPKPQDPPAIIQVARIEVDKEGTEAAAVTEVFLNETSAMPDDKPKYYDMVCDRPFMYYITDTVNGDIAFIGVVNHIDGE